MELHSTSKHLSSVSHCNKVAKYEEIWGINTTGNMVANSPTSGFSYEQISRHTDLVENLAP